MISALDKIKAYKNKQTNPINYLSTSGLSALDKIKKYRQENPYDPNKDKEYLLSQRKKLQTQLNNYERQEKTAWWDEDKNVFENVGNVLYKTFAEKQTDKYKDDEEYKKIQQEYQRINQAIEDYTVENKQYSKGVLGGFEKVADTISGNAMSSIKGIESSVNKLTGQPTTSNKITYEERLAQKAREETTGLGGVGLDLVGSFTRMIPQMVAPNPVTATAVGFANYGGSAYNDAKREGYSEEQATIYGLTVGGLETAMSKVLGGFENVYGKSALGKLTNKIMQNVIKSKVMRKTLSGAVGEFSEEYLQQFLEPIVKNTILGEENGADFWNTMKDDIGAGLKQLSRQFFNLENLYAGGLGALSSIGLQLPMNISQSINSNQNNSQTTQKTSNEIILEELVQREQNNKNNVNLPILDNSGNIVNSNKFQYVKSDNSKIDNLRKSANQYFNNSVETQNLVNTIEKVIGDKNYNVVFDNSIKNKNGQSVNAQITTNKNGEIEIKINPNSQRAGEFLLTHEITHAIETDSMKNLILDYASKNTEFNQALESLKQIYGTDDVSSEVIADISGQLLGNQEFINSLSMEQPSVFKKVYNKIIELANKITGNSRESLFIRDLKNKWETAYRNTTMEKAISNINNNTIFSIQTDINGNKYVNVDTDQDIFDGKSLLEQNKIARKYILDHFRENGLIYNDENVNVNSKTAIKYTNPKEKITRYNKNVKNRISTELDNLLSVSKKISESFDKKNHSFAKDGWEYYQTLFNIDGNYFTGILNVGKNGNQKTLYDINNIKKTTQNGKLDNSSVILNKSSFSKNNIPQSNKNVKSDISTNYSMQNQQNNLQWQDYLEKNYKATGTRTEMRKLLPTQEDIKKMELKDINLPFKISEESQKLDYIPQDPTKESTYDDVEIEKIAQILDEKPVTEKQKDNRAKIFLTTKFVDKGYYVDKLARQYKNRELSAKYDYSLLHNGIANEIIGNGRYDNHGNKVGKSLYEVFRPIENANLTKKFSEYLYHMHNIDRMNLNNNYGEDNKPVFGNSITAEKSQEIVNEILREHPEFETYAKDVYDYNNANLQMLVDNGVISQESMEYYNKKYPHYVPIIRNNTNTRNQMIYLVGKNASVGVPIKKAKGGNTDIIPLKEAMAMRTMQTVNSALKNDFGLELLKTIYGDKTDSILETTQSLDETIDNMDSTKIVEPKTSDREATFTIYKDGKKITMEISDEIYEALTPRKTGTIKVLNKINNLRRALLTEYNPAFMITNSMKDIQDGSLNSKHPTQFIKSLPEAIAQLKNKGKLYQLYIANGGGQDTYFNYDTGTNVKSDKKYIPTGNKILDTIKLPLKVLDQISSINQAIEMTPRLAEFIASLEAGDSIQTAMYNAQEITTNFKRGGDLTKTLDRNGVTFLNAGTQGFLKQIRNVQDAKVNGLRGTANLGVKALFWGTSWMLLNDLLWGDDDDYEELSDYVKNNYYIIGKYGDGKFIRIPKGRVVSIIQKGFEETWDFLNGEDVDLDQMADLVKNQIIPSDPTENNIFSPLLQAFGSENGEAWYGGDLVPSRLQNLPAAEQYDESTDSFSIWLGKTLNISPYKINYVLDQYSGVIGDFTLPYLTKEAETSGIIAPIKDKFTTDSTLNNQNSRDFYDLKEKLQKQNNSSTATEEDKLKYKFINSINSEISELYKEKREVQNSSMSDDKKMTEIRKIQTQINELAKKGINEYTNVEVLSNYATVSGVEFYLNSENEWQKIEQEEQVELQDLSMTDEDKNIYFDVKIKANSIKNDKTKTSTTKKSEISNLILQTDLNDEQLEYLYQKYYSSEEALKNVMDAKIPVKDFIKFNSQEFTTDYYSNGTAVPNSRKNKVINYVNSLNLSIPQKAMLIKMEYSSYDRYDNQIINYINNMNYTKFEKASILKRFGINSYDTYIINYIKSLNITLQEKTEMLEDLGFTVRNGRVYS